MVSRIVIDCSLTLELAMREGLALATLDTALRHAAEACHVPLFQPST